LLEYFSGSVKSWITKQGSESYRKNVGKEERVGISTRKFKGRGYAHSYHDRKERQANGLRMQLADIDQYIQLKI
jgi:hypothetical protein